MRSSKLSNDVKPVLSAVYRQLGALGRKNGKWFEQGRYDLLVQQPLPKATDPSFPLSYASYSLMRKCSGFDIGIDRAATALAGWHESEDRCAFVNFMGGILETDVPEFNSLGAAVLSTASRKITSVLGDFSVDSWFRDSGFSGGASTQRKRTESAIQNKFADNPHVTLDAYPLWRTLLWSSPCLQSLAIWDKVSIRNYGTFQTVPKDAKTERPIIIEPQGNMFFQKGLGTMIRNRLRRVGINLNDQSVNQGLAYNNSDIDVATVDLSAASDLISYETVKILFQHSPEWFDALLRVRTPYVKVGDAVLELEKFSGMGNGFTFELESLIFYCIAHACLELEREFGELREQSVLSVYGDDIIINSKAVDTLYVALEYFGFKVNVEKSFSAGPFRESCGVHTFFGRDISPIYIKDQTFKTVGDWYWLYNSLSALAERLDIDLSRALELIRRYLVRHNAWNYVPLRYGLTSGIRAPFDVAVPKQQKLSRNRKIPYFRGWLVKHYCEITSKRAVSQEGAYNSWLHSVMNDSREIEMHGPLITWKLMKQQNYSVEFLRDLEAMAPLPGTLRCNNYGTGRYHFQTVVVSAWD